MIHPVRPDFPIDQSPSLPPRRLFEDPSPDIASALLSPLSYKSVDVRGPLSLQERLVLALGLFSLAAGSTCLLGSFLLSPLDMWATLGLYELVALACKSFILYGELDEELRQEVSWPSALFRAAVKVLSYVCLYQALRGRPMAHVQVAMGCLPILHWMTYTEMRGVRWLGVSLYAAGLLWLAA